MAGHCCEEGPDHSSFVGDSTAYRRILMFVIALNAAMFAVELAGGAWAQSMALQADALDFAADAATYGLTLWAIGRAARVRATAALIKGMSLAAMALYVFAAAAYRVLVLDVPEPVTMGVIGAVALAVNVASALLLLRYSEGDANVRSVWLCSRNDAIGNVAVIGAAAAVGWTGTAWPDLVVAAAMAALFLSSSLQIVRRARRELAGEPVASDERHVHVHHATRSR